MADQTNAEVSDERREACPTCGGIGTIVRYVDDGWAGVDIGHMGRERREERCTMCDGTGKIERRSVTSQASEGASEDGEHFFGFEHDDEPANVRALALKLAIERGGQTCPVSDYDVVRAREAITGEVKEIDRLHRELAAQSKRVERLETALGRLIKAYVSLMETGRDRILQLGGTCDHVDVMERGDPYLAEAKQALQGGRS